MEIVIGATPRLTPPQDGTPQAAAGAIEAKVLHVRPARGRREGSRDGHDKRVNGSAVVDPAGGRVLVLLVAEGYKIPKDLQSGKYRAIVRFVRR